VKSSVKVEVWLKPDVYHELCVESSEKQASLSLIVEGALRTRYDLWSKSKSKEVK